MSSSSSSSSSNLTTRNITIPFINQGHGDIIPFTWIVESGTVVTLGSSSILGFSIEANDSPYLNYNAVINRDNSSIAAVPNVTNTIYVPELDGAKYQHEKTFYVDIVARDTGGIKDVRTHVEPNAYEFEKVEEVGQTFMIPVFKWSN